MDAFQLNIENMLFKRKFEESNSITEKINLCKEYVKKFDVQNKLEIPIFPHKSTYDVIAQIRELDKISLIYTERDMRNVFIHQNIITEKERYLHWLEKYIITNSEEQLITNSIRIMTAFNLDSFIKDNVRLKKI